uniref:Placenta associated 9 n=1 Tax=Rattus norvegicus TaxID=10116 RepID=D4A4Q7_RAT
MERLPLRWDPGLRLLSGYGGASRGGGQVLWSQNPEPPRNFGSDCISSGRAGAIPRRRLRTNGCTRWLPTMQPLLCALAGLALLRAGAGEWSQGPRDIPGRRAVSYKKQVFLEARGHNISWNWRYIAGSFRRPIKLTAAESPSGPGEDLAWSPGCDRHMAVQGRLNIVEETVEKTVEHLEAEVTGLLGLLEELASNLPPGPFSPKPDLLGDDGF